MLSAPARGDRPATTSRRWHLSSPSSSRRRSTTSWPRRDGCGRARVVTYSPKVFVPLTTLCRDVCGYCTFARPPRRGERAYLTEDEVLAIARAGAEAGCTEALFTLGDRPEARYRVARDELARARLCDDARVPRPLRRPRPRGDGAAAAPEPRRDDARGAASRSAPWPRRWGSCSRRPRSGSPRAAGRTGPRPTSSRRGGSRRCGSRASSRSRSRAGSSSGSARRARSGSTRSWRSGRWPTRTATCAR